MTFGVGEDEMSGFSLISGGFFALEENLKESWEAIRDNETQVYGLMTPLDTDYRTLTCKKSTKSKK